jgi:hypothetical protein
MTRLALWLRLDPLLHGATLALLAYAAMLPFAMVADQRTVLGVDPWIKPQKFAISIAIFLATAAWLIRAHHVGPTFASVVRWVLFATMVVEIVLLSLQSARGVRSHFNVGAHIDGTIYGVMGVAVVIATLAMLVLACAPLRSLSEGGPAGPATRLGIRMGEALFLLGCAWGAYVAPRTGHSVGGEDGGPGLPYVNWSTRHGDTRVAHFVLLHALQALPLLGMLIDALRWPRALIAGGAASLLALSIALATQALRGLPMLRLP